MDIELAALERRLNILRGMIGLSSKMKLDSSAPVLFRLQDLSAKFQQVEGRMDSQLNKGALRSACTYLTYVA
jgi:hypothetical protein